MNKIVKLLIVSLLAGCATSPAERRMRDSGEDVSDTARNVSIGLAALAVGAALIHIAKKGGSAGYPTTPSTDFEWDWDQFYNSNYQLIWACRGVQTGQFADASHCAYRPQTDLRWLGK